MGLLVTFHSPKTVEETKFAIMSVVRELNGKINKTDGNTIYAEWRSKRFIKIMPTKFTFFVGPDMVRVIVGGTSLSGNGTMPIIKEQKLGGLFYLWDDFILKLCEMYPLDDFRLRSGNAAIDAIKFLSDGVQQVYTTSTWYSDSVPLFPGGISRGVTTSETKMTNKLLAQVRYTNGLTYEGELYRNSALYQEIIVNMSLYEKR
ncbi:MAG: hypothetical protein Q4A54_09110 [Parabacteroides sp.]|nr:hypothetical protein [Parabacteroides sp.]